MIDSLHNVSLRDLPVQAPSARPPAPPRPTLEPPAVQPSATTQRASRAVYSTQAGIALVQTADGGLSRIQDSLQRMRELSVQVWSGTVSQQAAAEEIGQLQHDIDQTSRQTRYNHQSVLSSTRTYRVRAGSETLAFTIEQTTARSLGVEAGQLRLGSREEALASVQRLDQAIEAVTQQRRTLGDTVLARLYSVPSNAAAQGNEAGRQILQRPEEALAALGTPRLKEGML